MVTINKDDLEGMGPCVGVTIIGIAAALSYSKQLMKAGCFVAVFPYPLDEFRIIVREDDKNILKSILDGYLKF